MRSLERVSAASAGEAAAFWLEDDVDDEEADVDVEDRDEDMLLGSEDSTSTSSISPGRGGKQGHSKARSAGEFRLPCPASTTMGHSTSFTWR